MKKSYGQIIRETLDAEMNKDSRIFLIGEDIGEYGGAFGITLGLAKKYPTRVINSPMSEQAIVGLGVGAALNGLKPVVEIMFMDFMTLAYDQLFNHASIFNYISKGRTPVPLVIRVPAGGGRGYGATHSKTLIGPLMHVPGLYIVAPSNAAEAGGLLRSALEDKNPVVFVEHKLLYSVKEEFDDTYKGDGNDLLPAIPLGKAKVIKEGTDLLIISYSKTVVDCLQIATELEAEGKSIEVIDLRTVSPLDMETIRQSVEKIGKVLIVEEGYSECGVASEIIARINEECFFSLDAPIRRICARDVPLSCSPQLENAVLPTLDKIRQEIQGALIE